MPNERQLRNRENIVQRYLRQHPTIKRDNEFGNLDELRADIVPIELDSIFPEQDPKVLDNPMELIGRNKHINLTNGETVLWTGITRSEQELSLLVVQVKRRNLLNDNEAPDDDAPSSMYVGASTSKIVAKRKKKVINRCESIVNEMDERVIANDEQLHSRRSPCFTSVNIRMLRKRRFLKQINALEFP